MAAKTAIREEPFFILFKDNIQELELEHILYTLS